ESIPAPDVDPVSLGISLIKPELWSLSDGLIRFRAVSQAECRRVRHRCELRLFNGSAVTAAQVKRCVSRVQTDFAVVAELIDTVNSTVVCYKQAGTVNYSLPLFEKFNGDSQILLESLRVLQCAFCLQQLQASEACQRNVGCTRSDVSKPTGPQCFSSVMSQFLAFAQPSDVAGSTVRCRLLNGSSALLMHPELGFGETRLAGVWERPLLAASSTTAVLAIIALVAVVACFVLMRSGRRPPWKESPDASVPDDSTGVYVT
uniref:Secreted protein n=1 Tax=Macrostomum lignano TaxID=282301 RepID=A0A1I8GS11_9PLAT